MAVKTELPIHDVILRIMYLEDMEKPKEMSPKDVLWKIDNPEITERYIREVLDWLVREKKVNSYLDKYTLERYEFLELKKKYGEIIEEGTPETSKTTYFMEPPPSKFKGLKNKIIFWVGIVAVLYISFLVFQIKINNDVVAYEIPSVEINKHKPYIQKIELSEVEQMTTQEKFDDIAQTISKQHKNNINLKAEVARLYAAMDSLNHKNDEALNKILTYYMEAERTNIENIQLMKNRMLAGNIVFLLLILVISSKIKF
ncbi:MAG: DUF5457 domain-containing protein, partial [Bacteroidales bacterium]|nr:DUF5457 domain-containing protein [Bacteroidales bacterium]